MDNLENPNDLVAQYEIDRPVAEAFTLSLAALLDNLLRLEGIEFFTIEKRTKDLDSFRNKVLQPSKAARYNFLGDVTDLSGLRIIAYTQEDCEAAGRCIRKNFDVDELNSVDKSLELDPDRFGYVSTHYVIALMSDRCALAENVRFSGRKAEIQVRTLLQHTWAAIEWKLQYKSEREVPRELRRRLFRISALLESADAEFSAVGADVKELRRALSSAISERTSSVHLDAESLRVLSRQSSLIDKLYKLARTKMPKGSKLARIDEEPELSTDDLLDTLDRARLSDLTSVYELLTTNEDRIKRIFASLNADLPLNTYHWSPMGLLRLAVIASLPKDQGSAIVRDSDYTESFREPLLKAIALQ